MANEPSPMTAQQRLAISRRALVNQLQGKNERGESEYDGKARRSNLLDRFAWTSMARKVGERWWHRHPANAVSQLAIPVLERYTRQQPFKAVGGAMAAGALIMFLRPWRLLSATAILATVLKTSDVAGMVTSLMQKSGRASGE